MDNAEEETSGIMREDDLKKIPGIGEVLQAKLNSAGVFTFRQIATLDDESIEKVSSEIDVSVSLIRRGDWIGNAREQHFLKYKEQI